MNELSKFNNPVAKVETFDQIQIGMASPERSLLAVRLLKATRNSRYSFMPHPAWSAASPQRLPVVGGQRNFEP